MADKISVEIGLEGGEDVRKTLEEIVGGVDGLKNAAEELGKTDATVDVKAEGADETKDSIDGVKTAAEDLGKTDATVHVKAEGADEAKASIDEVKNAAEELGQVDATVNFGDTAQSANEAKGALDPISQSATILSASIDTLKLGMNRAEAATDAFGVAATRLGARMTRSLGPLGVFARALGPLGIAIGVVAGSLIKFGDSTADSLNKLVASSAKLDLSAQKFDQLQKALTQAGISQDAILPGLQQLKQTLSQDFFPTDVITGLKNFIAQLERMPDGAERTNLAMKTLGDSLGAQVIAGLQTGTISAQNFATALAGITPATQQQIVEAAKYQQALNQLNTAWNEFKATVAAPILTPVFQFMIGEIQKLQSGISQIKNDWQALKNVLQEPIGVSSLEKLKNLAVSAGSQLKSLTIPGLLSQGIQFAAEKLGLIAPAAQQAGAAVVQAGQQGSQAFKPWSQDLAEVTAKMAQAEQAAQRAAAVPPPPTDGWVTLANGIRAADTAVQTFVATYTGIAWSTISSAGVAAWNAITGAIQGAIDKLLQFIGLKPSAPATGGGAPGMASGGLLGGRGTGTSDSNLAWLSRGEYIMPASAVRQPGVLSFLEALRRSGGIPSFADGGVNAGPSSSLIIGPVLGRLAKQLLDIVNSINSIMAPYMQSVAGFVQTAKGMDQSMLGVQNAIMRVADELVAMENSIKVKGGNARGGLLGGRGTGTSDSNLAWVSRGEHIMPAAAVRQPGVLEFLELLRRSGGNLSRVLDGMGRFALGGMIPRTMAIPAFAAGGLAGGSNVTIQFPGLPAIGGLRASSDVVDQLHKAAALAQVRSGGRKPSRYS